MSQHPELRLIKAPRGLCSPIAAKTDCQDPELIHGPENLQKFDFINNHERFKSVLVNGFLQHRQSVTDVTRLDQQKLQDVAQCLVSYQKQSACHANSSPLWRSEVFAPFKRERDHLGRLIDSVSLRFRN